MRARHRAIRPTTRDSAPTILVAVGATTRVAPAGHPHAGQPHVIDSAHVSVRRRSRGGWGAAREVACTSPAEVWAVLDGLARRGRRVYVVAGRASDLLTMLGWWQRVDRREVTIWERRRPGDPPGPKKRRHPLVMQGRPDIIGYSLRGCPYRWVSVTNWCDLSIADAADQIAYPIPAGIDRGDKWESVQWPAADQARVISGYMTRLIDWWLAQGCGSWQDTPGAAAWSSYLRRQDEYPIVQHDDERVMSLESRACYGGRASTWYFGPIGDCDRWGELADAPPRPPKGHGIAGPLTRYDVRSMYPTLLRDERYPVRLLRRETRPTLDTLRAGLRYHLCVAVVTLRTDRAIYPRRVGADVQYPTGEYHTTLTTPEVRQALDAGELVGVHEVAWYTPGAPFRAWASWALGLRQGMRDAGDTCGEAMVKLLANSLGGRLARRKMGWTDRPAAVPRVIWGDWWHTDRATGETSQWRSLCGHVQEMERSDHRPATLAACYAHLTAYGRCRMNRVREVAGKREVIWQDTDGVVVTQLGGERIERSGHYHPTDMGMLRRDGTIHDARYLTAKHYWRDGTWVLSGIHSGFTVVAGCTARDETTVNPARTAVDPAAQAVYRSVRLIDLTRIEPGVQIDDDGWAVPPAVAVGPITRCPKGQLLLPEMDQ